MTNSTYILTPVLGPHTILVFALFQITIMRVGVQFGQDSSITQEFW